MKTFDGYKKRNLTDKDYALLAGGGHKALDTLFSALSSDTTNAIKITVGGTEKSITTDTLKTSLGLGSNAYTSTAYLPLAGGTMTGNIILNSNAIIYNANTTSSWENPRNSGIRILNNVGNSVPGSPSSYACGLSVSGYYGFQIATNQLKGNELIFRNTRDGIDAPYDWVILYHSGNLTASVIAELGTLSNNITGNAATATKLQTARSIWGLNFDGTKNISGALTEVTNITASGHISDAALGYTLNTILGVGWHTVARLSEGSYSADIYISNVYYWHRSQGLHIRIVKDVIEVLSSNITTITKVRYVDRDVDIYYSVTNADPFYWRIIGNGCVVANGAISTKTGGLECEVNVGVSVNSNLMTSGNVIISGNVGIGTSTPSYKLDVDGKIQGKAFIKPSREKEGRHGSLFIGDKHGVGDDGIFYESSSDLWFRIVSESSILIGTTGNSNGTVLTDYTKSVIIRQNGNVGIGTNAPSYKLDVVGTINTNTKIYSSRIEINGANANNPYITFGGITDEDGTIKKGWILQYASTMNFGYGTTATDILVGRNGNVGIGIEPNNSFKLKVNGALNAGSGTIIDHLTIHYSNEIDCMDGDKVIWLNNRSKGRVAILGPCTTAMGITMSNGDNNGLFQKDSSGVARRVLKIGVDNDCLFGDLIAIAGYKTYIEGNELYLRTSTAEKLAVYIDSSLLTYIKKGLVVNPKIDKSLESYPTYKSADILIKTNSGKFFPSIGFETSNYYDLVLYMHNRDLYIYDDGTKYKTPLILYHSGNLPAYPTKESWNYDDRYLKLSGGTMSGSIKMGTSPLFIRSNSVDHFNMAIYPECSGSDSFTFINDNAATSFTFVQGQKISGWSSGAWNNVIPAMQIKKNCVYINECIKNGVDPTETLKIAGTSLSTGRAKSNLGFLRNKISDTYGNLYIGKKASGTGDDGIYYESKGNAWFRIASLSTIALSCVGEDGELYTSSWGSTLSITLSGNFGIGTVNPATSYKLHVNGGSLLDGSSVIRGNLNLNRSGNDNLLIKTEADWAIYYTGSNKWFHYVNLSGAILIYSGTYNSSALVGGIYIGTNNNVSISPNGNFSHDYALNVNGTVKASLFKCTADSQGLELHGGTFFKKMAGKGLVIGCENSRLLLELNYGTTYYLVLHTGSSINWSQISSCLVANDEFNIVANAYSGPMWFNCYSHDNRGSGTTTITEYRMGNGSCNYTKVIASSFYQNSDIRYKNIQENIYLNILNIASLPIFKFTWNDRNDSKIYLGTSALSVLNIIPELVTYNTDIDFYNLDYATLGTIAGITACKELVNLKSEIEQLRERVAELEQKLNDYGIL